MREKLASSGTLKVFIRSRMTERLPLGPSSPAEQTLVDGDLSRRENNDAAVNPRFSHDAIHMAELIFSNQ